jgi:GntR family transcriptional regulator/MocR family aminotransferase
MSGSDKVIYLGTFSKSIAPALRVSYLVLPRQLSEICRLRLSHFNTTVSMPDQIVLARFLESGLFERHINRMRTLYRRKRDHFLRELSPYRESLEISGTDAGLHLVCRVRRSLSEKDLVRLAADSGIIVYGISGYYLKSHATQGSGENAPDQNQPEDSLSSIIRSVGVTPGSTVLLGYGALCPADISRGVRALSAAWCL